jgi:hypothetical protein
MGRDTGILVVQREHAESLRHTVAAPGVLAGVG